MMLEKRAGGIFLILSLFFFLALSSKLQARDFGPDPFGYFGIDSLPPKSPDSPTYCDDATGPACNGSQEGFEDISACGVGCTALALTDDGFQLIPIGFNFTYYGITYTNVFVVSNGFIRFNDSQAFPNFTGVVPQSQCTSDPNCIPDDCSNNLCILKTKLPDPRYPAMVAAYLTDLDPALGGGVFAQVLGTAPNRRLLIQFQNVVDKSNTFPTTFEFKLFEDTNQVIVVYKNVPSNGKAHVAGMQNETGTSGLLYDQSNFSLTQVSLRYLFPPLPSAFGLFVNDAGQTAQAGNPGSQVILKTFQPAFSAMFQGTDPTDTANRFQLQIATTNTFLPSTLILNTQSQGMPTVANDFRTGDIPYQGPSLSTSTEYFWRMTFWDGTCPGNNCLSRTVTPYKSSNSFCIITCGSTPGSGGGSGLGGGCYTIPASKDPQRPGNFPLDIVWIFFLAGLTAMAIQYLVRATRKNI